MKKIKAIPVDFDRMTCEVVFDANQNSVSVTKIHYDGDVVVHSVCNVYPLTVSTLQTIMQIVSAQVSQVDLVRYECE